MFSGPLDNCRLKIVPRFPKGVHDAHVSLNSRSDFNEKGVVLRF